MNQITNFILWMALWCNYAWLPGCYTASNQSENGNNTNETPKLNVYLYSKDLSKSQENKSMPCAIPDFKELKLWKDQSYGTLVMSQKPVKNDSVPVWKDINDGLKNADLYIDAVISKISEVDDWCDVNVIFHGVSGVLKFYNETNGTAERPLMYSFDTERNRVVPIPKLIYRVIRGEWHHDGVKEYEAVIVIHNDPKSRHNGDRLDCERIFNWDVIENIFDETGLAYVCQLTEEFSQILGINNYSPDARPLELSTIPLYYSEHPEWKFTYPYHSEERDYTSDIYGRYKSLCDELE